MNVVSWSVKVKNTMDDPLGHTMDGPLGDTMDDPLG